MKILSRTPSRPSCCAHGPPRCSRAGTMVPQGAKMEAPSPPNGSREELKGAGGRGRSPEDSPHTLMNGISNHLQNLQSSAGLPTAAGTPKKSSKSHHFQMDFNRDPLWSAKSATIEQQCHRDSNTRQFWKNCKNHATTETQHPPKSSISLKIIAFLKFCSICKKYANWLQNGPWNDPKLWKLLPQASRKRCQQKKHKNGPQTK